MELPSRKSLRLQHYDYHSEGGYFITICADKKKCIFSKVEPSTQMNRAGICLTELGIIARDTLANLQERYNMEIGSYVIMPNHIHMILIMDKQDKTTVGQILGAYKSLVTKQWRDRCNAMGVKMGKIWQRNYYEHIIRNDVDYLEKARYIDENPDNWFLDDEYAP